LPQLYASEFGWPEMVATVASVYNNLPPDVRGKTAIFVQDYAQAGAIELFGPKYGLPWAISGHQSYFFWGPGDYTGESMIVMGDSRFFRITGGDLREPSFGEKRPFCPTMHDYTRLESLMIGTPLGLQKHGI
jgi:hypothetical protein